MAIEAHNARGEEARSVLLFASRTEGNNSFNDALELQLWWAWTSGIVCVVSAGNEGTATYAPGKRAPDSKWVYPPNPKPSSPSRYFMDESQGDLLEEWTFGEPNPGTSPYLIMVGASNAARLTPDYANWSTTSSRGPDVDILAPGLSIPCANVIPLGTAPTGYPIYTTATTVGGVTYPAGSFTVATDCLVTASGCCNGLSTTEVCWRV